MLQEMKVGYFVRFVLMFVAAVLAGLASPCAFAAEDSVPIRVAIVGLVHGHAQGLLESLPKNKNVHLVAIVEPDAAVANKYAAQFHLERALFFTDTDKMLDQVHPAAVLVYTSIQEHRAVIEAAARHGVNAMVEKPLATTLADAIAIRRTAREHHVEVLVNYETTWYPSNEEVYKEVDGGKLGEVRRIVVHDGHEGPKEIGVDPEFLNWLTDPEKNGAGALFDFGCYGADLATWLMHGQAPVSVTAVAQTDKPAIYPKVDDDATVILRYPAAQAVLQPSWNWPFSRKDMEVYGATGYAVTVGRDQVRVRRAGDKAESSIQAPLLGAGQENSLDYLAAVLRGQIKATGDLSSLDTNMVVMQILDAARESAKEGRTVVLKPLPN